MSRYTIANAEDYQWTFGTIAQLICSGCRISELSSDAKSKLTQYISSTEMFWSLVTIVLICPLEIHLGGLETMDGSSIIVN